MWEQSVNRMSAAPGSVLRCIAIGGFPMDAVPGLIAGSFWVDGPDLALVISWGDYTNYVLVLCGEHVGWVMAGMLEAA